MNKQEAVSQIMEIKAVLPEHLQIKLIDAVKVLANFKMIISHVDNPMQKRTMRREIARLNTFIQQKESAGENK